MQQFPDASACCCFRHFHFPVFLLMVAFCFEWLIAVVLQHRRPPAERDIPWRTVFCALAPIGCATALEISFSCLSLLTLSVSFHVMVKAGSPIAVLLWSIALGLQRPTFRLGIIVLTVCFGISLCTWGQHEGWDAEEGVFPWDGFFYILASAFVAGFRWSFSQVYLQREKKHPITLLYFVLPPAVLTLIPFFMVLEADALQEHFRDSPTPSQPA